jgi:hypothetical protein
MTFGGRKVGLHWVVKALVVKATLTVSLSLDGCQDINMTSSWHTCERIEQSRPGRHCSVLKSHKALSGLQRAGTNSVDFTACVVARMRCPPVRYRLMTLNTPTVRYLHVPNHQHYQPVVSLKIAFDEGLQTCILEHKEACIHNTSTLETDYCVNLLLWSKKCNKIIY